MWGPCLCGRMDMCVGDRVCVGVWEECVCGGACLCGRIGGVSVGV